MDHSKNHYEQGVDTNTVIIVAICIDFFWCELAFNQFYFVPESDSMGVVGRLVGVEGLQH